MEYITTHWRGQQTLVQSTLVNGVALYFALVVLLMAVGKPLGLPVYLGLGFFLIWQVWASVGIVRAGMRRTFDKAAPTSSRVGGAVAMAGVAAVTIVTLADAPHLFFRF